MKIAIVCSNYYNLSEQTMKGTEIFSYTLINNLVKFSQKKGMDYTAFSSGASRLPIKIISIDNPPSSADPEIVANGKHIIFELALISKAFSMQSEFDLYHINIGDGDIAMPFSPFVQRPILITLHHIYDTDYTREYFSFYEKQKNVFFVSASNAQRSILPELNYAATIHHGIDLEEYTFHPTGGNRIVWAGRAIPEKGPEIVIDVADKTKQEAILFGIMKEEFSYWVNEHILNKILLLNKDGKVKMEFDHERLSLIPYFQKSRLLLFPVQVEEAFGLVLIEAMACGTPVVAYARGSIPEIIEDGVNGYLVNPSNDDIRGDWVIKQPGIAGLCEAVDKIFSMSKKQYEEMRKACRSRVEKSFSVQRMIADYENLYEKIIKSFN
jgi:glycosyltransferase involved in cell wall biosynthesis